MEITKLDAPDDDGLLERLSRLCERVDDLLGRVRGGEVITPSILREVQREAVMIGLAKDPSLFRRFTPQSPENLN